MDSMTSATPEKDFAEELYDRIIDYCDLVHEMLLETLTEEQIREYREEYPDSPTRFVYSCNLEQYLIQKGLDKPLMLYYQIKARSAAALVALLQ